MRGNHGGETTLAVHGTKQRMQGVAGRLVEVAGRLVGEHERRRHHQRPRDGHALLLPARQHRGTMIEPLAEADALEQRLRGGAGLDGRTPRDTHRHLGVLERRELRQQVMELEDEPDLRVPERHQRRRPPSCRGRDPGRRCGPIRAVEAAEQMEERALADAAGADDGDHFAGVDRQIEIAQHVDVLRADAIAFVQRGDFDEGHGLRLRATGYGFSPSDRMHPDRLKPEA